MAMANMNDMQFIQQSGPGSYQTCDSSETAPIVYSNITAQNEIETSQSDTTVRLNETEEAGRACRIKKKLSYPLYCPICSVTIRPSELESHFNAELARMDKLSAGSKRKPTRSPPPSNGPTTSYERSAENQTPEKCWETYQSVKENRQSRLKTKSRKRKAEEALCPVCNVTVSGDINVHVDECLRKSEGRGSDDEDIDVGGDDFREYEWAGQTRLRACSILEGGYNAVGVGTSVTRVKSDEEDMDLIVDEDDTERFGPPQYSERDVVAVGDVKESKDEETLRLAIVGPEEESRTKIIPPDCDTAANHDDYEPESHTGVSNPTVEALKQRIKELESSSYKHSRTSYKCLICMDKYKTPVTSVCCWHVHCELCWLKTLATKKLCPQCNMITSPSDLRRIYI